MYNAYLIMHFFCVKKTFRERVCHMCGNYSKTKYEIMKHYQKGHIIFFIPNRRSWDFKPLLEKANLTLVDSLSDKPKVPVRNVGSQPLSNRIFLMFHLHIAFFLGQGKSARQWTNSLEHMHEWKGADWKY